MSTLTEQIMELKQNYNDLGEDLILLEAVLQIIRKENDFPKEYVASTLTRISEYIQQHTETINQLTQFLNRFSTAF